MSKRRRSLGVDLVHEAACALEEALGALRVPAFQLGGQPDRGHEEMGVVLQRLGVRVDGLARVELELVLEPLPIEAVGHIGGGRHVAPPLQKVCGRGAGDGQQTDAGDQDEAARTGDGQGTLSWDLEQAPIEYTRPGARGSGTISGAPGYATLIRTNVMSSYCSAP